ncbi:MAG: prepilin-type N-terminal cleavage/methylation domain-containing protein [Planctomycetota bacterium]|nr:MAG: prepilin-type N-terminal cleavage/methylation domain-containing protein [Planctomycetota bacterium]
MPSFLPVAGGSDRRPRGFTLIEILIAIFVLGFAFLGVMSMLVGATRQAGTVVEDGYASTLAKSVYEAIRIGVRDFSFSVTDTDGHVVSGFLLEHEGVPGAPPALPANSLDASALSALRASDHTIFLPPGPPAGATGSNELVFVFPRPTDPATENGFSNGASMGRGKNNAIAPVQTDWGTATFDVRRVYSLAPPPGTVPPITGGGAAPTPDLSEQYGFAVAVRRHTAPPLLDASGNPLDWNALGHLPRGYERTDGLYEVRVLVYRNFDPNVQSQQHYPVGGGNFVGLVALDR